MTSGFDRPAGGPNGVPGEFVNPPVPLPSSIVTEPVGPGLPHRSPHSGVARSVTPSLLKSAATSSLGNVPLVGTLVAVVKETSALAGAATPSDTSAVERSTRAEMFVTRRFRLEGLRVIRVKTLIF